MKSLGNISLMFLITASLVIASGITGEWDKNLMTRISEILRECQTIGPGTMRADVEKIFTTEGGFFVPMHQRYIYRRCPLIKVDVDFNRSQPNQSDIDPRPTDTVSKISKPYLEWRIID